MLVKGNEYRRVDLHNVYGGQRQGGISTPSDHPIVMLFSSPRGEEFGYKDGWTDDGLYLYSGEGQRDDMQMLRGNAAIRDHLQNNKTLHLFERSQKGHVFYIGEMVYHGHHTRQSPDITGTMREVIVFELKPID